MTDRAAFPVFSPILKSSANGKPPVYGHGVKIGKLMNVSTAPVYTVASELAKNKHRFEYAAVALGITEIPTVAAKVIFGYRQNGNTLSEPPTAGIQGGFGYCKRERIDGEIKWCAVWMYSVTFSPPSDSAITKGETVTFTTPSLTAIAVNELPAWREFNYFPTFEQARDYLKCKAGIA